MFAGLALLASACGGWSAENPQPVKVAIGVYLLDVYDLNLKDGSYVADFYLWLRWKGDVDPRGFEFMNGELDLKDDPDEQKIDGMNYLCYRLRGTFRSKFDFRNYPLDRQKLKIEIEDDSHDISSLVYEADLANMSAPPAFHLSGWETAAPPSYRVESNAYDTNYGDPTRPVGEASVFSRFVIEIPIKHSGDELIYLKTFIGVFISVAIAFLAFLIEPTDLDPRFGVGIAAIFGAVSSMIVVSSNMPENPYFTLSDQIHLASLSFIFLTIFASCVVLPIHKKGPAGLSQLLDKIFGWGMAAVYVAVIAFLSYR